jgi:hypothetical protein
MRDLTVYILWLSIIDYLLFLSLILILLFASIALYQADEFKIS